MEAATAGTAKENYVWSQKMRKYGLYLHCPRKEEIL
jgi:hypothetical protein